MTYTSGMNQSIISFLGIGTMGRVMAENLLKSGYRLHVWNRTKTKCLDLAKLGATIEDSPAVAAQKGDIILYSLSGTSAIDSVIFGANGVLQGIGPEKIAVDLSTTSPLLSKKQFEAFKAKGARFLDASVFGSVPEAKARGLWIVVGGEKEVFEKAASVFEELCESWHYMGGPGSGAATGLVGSLIFSVQLQALSEGLTLAKSAGLDLDQVIKIMSLPDFRSPMFEAMAPGPLKRNFEPVFSLKSLRKDIDYVMQLADERDLPLPATSLVRELIKGAVRQGWAEENVSALTKTMELLAATNFSTGLNAAPSVDFTDPIQLNDPLKGSPPDSANSTLDK
ncbi:MAG: NAD(P)-dependent oxidoreductase [Deltaproteobacteria bacterium]|nr:NAD(P)-dependent oxidoreductase [Deltaproteobacteria bacterium]MBI3293211.1 NAD(P)-dependent oxidoreductase [Deltaproteobacteria bacterium]